MIAVTSVRRYIGFENFSDNIPVCVKHDNGHRHYLIHLKSGTSIYVLDKINYIAFKVHFIINLYTGIIKITSIGPVERYVFAFLSVCVSRDGGYRYYPIHLKFGTNVCVKQKFLLMIVFGVHCLNCACSGMHKSISIYFSLSREILWNQFWHGYCA